MTMQKKAKRISDIDAEMSRKERTHEDIAIRCVFCVNVMKNSNIIVQKLSTIIDPCEDYSILNVEKVITDRYFPQVVSHVTLSRL